MSTLTQSISPGSHGDSPSAKQPTGKLPPNTRYCRCAACGSLFGGVFSFDLHRTGPADERTCMAPSAMLDKQGRPVMKLNQRGFWVRSYGRRPANLRVVA